MDERTDLTVEAEATAESAPNEQELRIRLKKAAELANRRATDDSPGVIRGAMGERLYSVDEMRQMTAKEVKGRYHSLLASLKRGFSRW